MSYVKPVRPTRRRRRRTWRQWLGWPFAVAGVLLFFSGNVGAVAGFNVLPFDQHHLISQLGGGVLAITGIRWATSR